MQCMVLWYHRILLVGFFFSSALLAGWSGVCGEGGNGVVCWVKKGTTIVFSLLFVERGIFCFRCLARGGDRWYWLALERNRYLGTVQRYLPRWVVWLARTT